MLHNKSVKYWIVSTPEFDEWLAGLDATLREMVKQRLARIKNDGHFGSTHPYDGLVSLTWKNGLRVYGAEIKPHYVVLYGGNKNGQSRDIKKAKRLLAGVDRRRLPVPRKP